MQIKIISEIEKEGEIFVAHLDKNYNVEKIIVTLSGEKMDEETEIEVYYAQNRITSNLISFANAGGGVNSSLELASNAPVVMSDIYIKASKADVEISKIQLLTMEELSVSAKCYPYYYDIDLGKNFYLDSVSVFTPEKGYSQYSIYTSLNGVDFDKVAAKTTKESCNPETGEIYFLGGKEARIIRVFLEYNSESIEAVLLDVKYEGRESGTPICPAGKINVESFLGSKYDVMITPHDTIDEVYSIIERRIGKGYKSWFDLVLESSEKDYFEITANSAKVHIKGNSGVSIAYGVNYYLKYYCKVNISQVGDCINMPECPVAIDGVLHRETKAKLRYAYNYCTHSYSMAFWGEKEWRDELDWLALNGVNLVLDIVAQEEVWRRFLLSIGYSHQAIKRFIAGPAYYAWTYMANLTGFGGPVHDSWFERRTELARKNQLIMRKLGMKPVLQGYSGMVPADILEYDKNVEIIPQGTWCSFQRPAMLRTTSACFKDYAKRFYAAQREVYGDISNYFATDPFHEGGITFDMKPREISREVLSAMINENKDNVWVIQSWQGNPTSELLCGIGDVENGRERALILDLYSEKLPNYLEGSKKNPSYGYDKEFDSTPWIYCMLNNFGGRLGLHGHLDNIARELPKVSNNCNFFAGIGITPEASANNPVLYDLFFEIVWRESTDELACEINLDEWLGEYTLRRYGKDSYFAKEAWKILKNTVYKAELNNLGQGAPECIVNARPAMTINAASTWGNSVISYDKEELARARKFLIEDYDILKDSTGYLYDLASVTMQVLSNNAQDCHKMIVAAYEEKSIDKFERYSREFLEIVDRMDTVAGASEYYSLARWVEQARDLSKNTDDFTKKIFEMNAKALITTWGSYNQSEIGGLHDYSNRQWSGLIKGFYKQRWKLWLELKLSELKGEACGEISWFEWEWNWVRSDGSSDYQERKVDLKNFDI